MFIALGIDIGVQSISELHVAWYRSYTLRGIDKTVTGL